MAMPITSAARRASFATSCLSRSGKACRCRRTSPRRNCGRWRTRHAAAWRTLQPGDKVSIGDVDVIVRHPPRPDWERQRVRNNDSDVIELRYGGVSFVFTGDIGREVEREIAASFERAPIRMLKVPHHGSATSSSEMFLDALRPDVAVISAGRGNPFGHPVPSRARALSEVGAAIFRTDQDGAVTIETDGETVSLRTFTERRLTLRTAGALTLAPCPLPSPLAPSFTLCHSASISSSVASSR